MTTVRRRGTHRSLRRCCLRSKTGIRTQARNDGGVVPLIAVLDELQVGRQMKPRSDLAVVVELYTLHGFQCDHRADELPEIVAQFRVEVCDAGPVLLAGFERAVAFN